MKALSAPEVSPGKLRAWAVALFAFISLCLWVGFSQDTFFATDGSFYFKIILDNHSFTNIAWSRSHAEYLSQWPLVLAVSSGVTDLALLEIIFGLGLWFPWVLGLVLSLHATRDQPALLFFYLISVVSLNLAAWSVFIGEHHVLLTLSWPIFFYAIRQSALSVFEYLILAILLVIHLRLYEAAMATGCLFAFIFGLRIVIDPTKWRKVANLLLVGLSIGAVVIALNSVVNPRDADNRSSFFSAMVDGLAHPYPWMGLLFVMITFGGLFFRGSLVVKAGWMIPVVIGVLALLLNGIPGGVSFSTRTLSLTLLPSLMIVAIFVALIDYKPSKQLLISTAGVITFIAILHIRHLQDWRTFKSTFQEVLASESGFVKPEPYGQDLVHWGWTNPLLSYLWSEGEVKTIVLNPKGVDYNPVDPYCDRILEDFLPISDSLLLEDKELPADEIDER